MSTSDFDLEYQNQQTESKIIAALERISQAFRVLLWQESKEYALSPIQVQVLIFLLYHSKDKRKVSYLAGEFNVTKATISDTIKALDQKGLIKKKYETQDTRSYIINLSAKGKKIAEQSALFTQAIRVPVDQLNAEDKDNLLLNLIQIIHHLNKSGVITIQRMCLTCSHYQPNHNGEKHFCKLLNQKLENSDLRIDCPEHVRKV